MEWYEVTRYILECLAYIATIALVPVGIYGLTQLRIAKNSLHTQSLRDAKKIASEQVIYFLEEILEEDMAIDDIEDKDIDLLNAFEYEAKADSKLNLDKVIDFNNQYSEDNIEEYVQEYERLIDKIFGGKLLNSMEAFSASVLSGVGDEKVVYESVGVTFVNMMRMGNLIEYVKYQNNRGLYYAKTKKLYELWNARYTKDLTESMLNEVEEQHKETSEELKEIKSKIDAIVADEIKPIGVLHPTKKK